jgi:hypothetical protein
MKRLLQVCLPTLLMGSWVWFAAAQEMQIPAAVGAGSQLSISTTGSGKATFYLVGPGASQKREITLGEVVNIDANGLQTAGDYTAILCGDRCHSATFYVSANQPANLVFLLHPSRVPVAQGDAVSGVAFPFDRYHNLILTPLTVDFQMTAKDSSLWSRSVRAQNGVAWFRTSSGRSAGLLQVTASVGDISTRRAAQQVASEPCNLRLSGERIQTAIIVQTEPVHDCAGNLLPDGTVVTFTATGPQGKGTVDAPIKQGIARAQLDSLGPSVVSVASGVVLGNEIHVGAKP